MPTSRAREQGRLFDAEPQEQPRTRLRCTQCGNSLTEEQLQGWQAWVASRPEHVRLVAERFEPWSLYRLTPTGQRVTIRSFGEAEDGEVTVRILVSGRFNRLVFDREVFGINPSELEPCDLPAPENSLGALLTPDQVEENLHTLRLLGRPDLWELDPETGEVRRRGQPFMSKEIP